MECYFLEKGNELLVHTTTCLNLKHEHVIIENETSQTQKVSYLMDSFICYVQNRQIH